MLAWTEFPRLLKSEDSDCKKCNSTFILLWQRNRALCKPFCNSVQKMSLVFFCGHANINDSMILDAKSKWMPLPSNILSLLNNTSVSLTSVMKTADGAVVPHISIAPGVNPHAMVFAPLPFEVSMDPSAQSQHATQGFIYAWKCFILSSNTGSKSNTRVIYI